MFDPTALYYLHTSLNASDAALTRAENVDYDGSDRVYISVSVALPAQSCNICAEMPHAYSSANLRPIQQMPYLKVGETLLLTITTKSNHCAVDGAEGNGALLINIAFWPAFGRLPVQRDAGLRYEIWIGRSEVTGNFCRDRVKNISFQSWFSTQSPETMNVLIFGSSMSGGGLDGKQCCLSSVHGY